MLSPAEWVALIGALTAAFVAVIKATSEAAKTRAEVAAMRLDMERARVLDRERRTENDQLLRETHHQVTPNNGGSIIDATARLEQAIERVHNAQRDAAADVRGIRRDIGRLTDETHEHEREAGREHREFRERLDDVEARLPPAPPHTDPHLD